MGREWSAEHSFHFITRGNWYHFAMIDMKTDLKQFVVIYPTALNLFIVFITDNLQVK
jgi:hypothetical protein